MYKRQDRGCKKNGNVPGSDFQDGEKDIEEAERNGEVRAKVKLCGIFCQDSVDVARYGALIPANSPTNCDAHLAESLFQICSGKGEKAKYFLIFSRALLGVRI